MSDLNQQPGASSPLAKRVTRPQGPLPTFTLRPSAPEPEFSSGLLEYFRMVRRRKGLLAIFAIAGALAGFLVGLPKQPVYRARTSLEVLELNEDFMNMKQANPISTTDYSYDTSESQTQVKILESDALVKRVIERMNPGAASKSKAKAYPIRPVPLWRKLFDFSDPGQMSKRDRLLNEAAASRAVRVTPRTRILELTIDSTNPKLAADFANTLANEFIEQSQETRWKSTQKTSEWLANELNETRLKLERSETALQQYARSSGLVFTDAQTNMESQKLQQIQQQLSGATADRITKQSRYELAQKAPAASLPDILNDPSLRQTAARINELNGQLANLEATYSPEYSKTKRIQAEVSSLTEVFKRDQADILRRIENDYREAARSERLLAASYDQQTREVVGQSEKSIQYNIRKREVDSNRQLYDTMLQQLKQSTVASAMRTSNVRVLDEADVPTAPIAPNFKINTVMGLIMALIAGSGYILVMQHGNRTLQGPGELHSWTGLPELGAIPNVSIAIPKRLTSGSRKGLIEAGVASTAAGFTANCATLDRGGHASWKRKPGSIAEAFRRILTALLLAGDGDRLPKVVVITSTDPADGKTTVVCNLGIASAEIGRRVLIIDGDLRHPCMHALFGLERKGFMDILREQKPLDTPSVLAMVQRTRIARLDLLACGDGNGSADLLYSPHLGTLLEQLANRYDTILIDTPPMGYLTDARVLARLADGIILVARARQTTRDAVLGAARQLIADRLPVLGFILNDWNSKTPSYYGYREPLNVYSQGEDLSRVMA
jgi:polysaccharide biosynthesis transport protein